MTGKALKIVFRVLNLLILLAVVGLAFSMMSMFMSSIGEIVYESGLPDFGDYVDEGAALKPGSEGEFNRKVVEMMEKMDLVREESSQTLNILDDVNAVILGVGADALSLLGQEELAQEVRIMSIKLKLKGAMLDYASHLNESGVVMEKREGMDEVKADFENLRRLLMLYHDAVNQTGGGGLSGRMREIMKPME